MGDAQEPGCEGPAPATCSACHQMKCSQLRRRSAVDPDLVGGADKAATDEAHPGGGDEMASRQLAQEVVDELAAGPRARNGPASGDPGTGFARHARTIAAKRNQSVMGITFLAQA